MERYLEIYGDGRVYEIEGEQALKVFDTNWEIDALLDALQFTLAKTYAIAPSDKQPPDVAERRGSRRINKEGFKLLTTFEGCELEAYDDGGGVWTIGYGHTKGVRPGMTITKAQADEFLENDLERFESFVEDAVDVSIDENQFSALVCFCFNVGPGPKGFGGSSLLKLLNQGSYQGAADQFPVWNKVKGKPWLGLTRRRLAERALFLGNPWAPFLTYQEEPARTLKLTDPPMEGDDVRQLQEALKKAGFAIKADGEFGKKTEEAVKQFQKQKGLTVDGKAGAGTQAKLGL